MGNRLTYLLIVPFLIFMYFFTYNYISKEVPLYPCDYVEQNIFLHDFSELLKNNFPEFLKNISHDIYNYNRNPFAIIFLLPFAFILKDFRAGFIFSVELVYMLPVMLLIWYIFNNFFYKTKEKLSCKSSILLFLSSIFFFPAIWYSVISGMPDICGMIPVLICYCLYFKYEFNKKINFKILLLSAFLLYLSFLSRRWYSVVIVSFMSAIVIENLLISFKNNNKIKEFLYTIRNLGFISVFFCIFAYFIQGGYFRNIFQNELAERALYLVQFNQLNIIVEHIGLFVCIIAFIGLIFNLNNKLVRFSFLNILIYLFMFITVMNNQFLWINHFAYIAVLICILFCAGLYSAAKFLKFKILSNIFVFFIILFNIFNFYTFFLIEKPRQVKFLLPETTAYPMQFKDYDKVLELYNYLENEYNKNNNIEVALYGLCDKIGYWQFRSINPDSEFAKKAIKFERITDEDFKDASYNEDFVILFDPPGIYFSDEFSQEIRKINRMFKQNKGIAQNYKKVKEIKLRDDNKTKVTLYKRK